MTMIAPGSGWSTGLGALRSVVHAGSRAGRPFEEPATLRLVITSGMRGTSSCSCARSPNPLGSPPG